MRSRLPNRRILSLRPFRPPNGPRAFTQNLLGPSHRPQLPFLTCPHRVPSHARFFTTGTGKWLKGDILQGLKWGSSAFFGLCMVYVIGFGITQEMLSRVHITPEEWTYWTRVLARCALGLDDPDADADSTVAVKWHLCAKAYMDVLVRLENPAKDGVDLEEQEDWGSFTPGAGKLGYDISKKSEEWRRAYYDILMGVARATENLEGWVLDRSRGLYFAGNQVRGPSNPNPRPVLREEGPAPKEEDCEVGFPSAEHFYVQLLTTKGFNDRQRIEAGIAYATWLDFKQRPEEALSWHKWTLEIATATAPNIVDPASYTLNTKHGAPTGNLLRTTTALALHYASVGEIKTALPMFVSILRARRSLSDVPKTMLSTFEPEEPNGFTKAAKDIMAFILISPQYTAPPPDGLTPPYRTPGEICEEAAVMAHIGEILYASGSSKTSQEDGLAWTREAVDIAELESRKKDIDKEGQRKCKQCLETGLENWEKMVARLATQERERKEAQRNKSRGWLSFGGKEEDVVGRWESEEAVVDERMKRVKDIIGESIVVNGSRVKLNSTV